MKYSIRFLIVQLLIFIALDSVYAWGKLGHRIVGEIAEKRITKETKLEIQQLVGTLSLADMSNWMDEIKSDDSWNHANPWHYVNIPDNSKYAELEKNPEGDLVQALYFFANLWKDKNESKAKRVVALKSLIHLMGDLHQPLHVGRKEDRGGNKIEVKWFGENKNLHQIWDEELIEFEKLSYTEYTRMLENSIKVGSSWSKGNLMDWINESYDLRKIIYSIDQDKLSYDYHFKHKELLNQQLLKAGIRLAFILNHITLKPKSIGTLPFKMGKTI